MLQPLVVRPNNSSNSLYAGSRLLLTCFSLATSSPCPYLQASSRAQLPRLSCTYRRELHCTALPLQACHTVAGALPSAGPQVVGVPTPKPVSWPARRHGAGQPPLQIEPTATVGGCKWGAVKLQAFKQRHRSTWEPPACVPQPAIRRILRWLAGALWAYYPAGPLKGILFFFLSPSILHPPAS